jgi:hypothetical protein
VLLGAVLIVASISFALKVVEIPVAEYDNLAEAQADGALERGWLPEFLPPHTSDIREAHNVDTSARWLEFTAPVRELRILAAHLDPITWQDARRTALPRPSRAGRHWPPELDEPAIATPRSSLGFYRATKASYCLAVDWTSGHAWGWSCAT